MTDAGASVVGVLLERHGRTYADEAGIELAEGTPASLFGLLCLSLLLSARIRAGVAVRAARALAEAGWTDPASLARSTWEERVAVLDGAGYGRYDERTARMLATTADMVLGRYRGDLGQLRERARRDRQAELGLLQEFPGIGPLGAAIFAREVQAVWPEVYPFADDRALRTAARLGLPAEALALSRTVVGRVQFARLVAALVRCGLTHDEGAILGGEPGTSASGEDGPRVVP